MTIELTDEARSWLVKNGYDESMGARPMARVIQTQIKTPLADEVLFGRLKNGGVVKVVVTADETGEKKLGFVYPEGPAAPRMERDLILAAKARGRARKRVEPASVRSTSRPSPRRRKTPSGSRAGNEISPARIGGAIVVARSLRPNGRSDAKRKGRLSPSLSVSKF